MDESESRMDVAVTDLIRIARGNEFLLVRLRCWCFGSVIALDHAKKNGHTVNSDVSKQEPHVWTEEEYQRELARIRDHGIMNGLTARVVNETFRSAHDEAASSIYK